MQKFATARDYPFVLMSQNPKIVSIVIKATLFILWNIYLIFAIIIMIGQEMVIHPTFTNISITFVFYFKELYSSYFFPFS